MNNKEITSVVDHFYKTGDLSISTDDLRAFFQKLAQMVNFIEDEEERRWMHYCLSGKYLKTANTFLRVSILYELEMPLSDRKNFRLAIEFIDLYKNSPGTQPIIVVFEEGGFYWDFAKRFFLETGSKFPQLIELRGQEKESSLPDDPEECTSSSDGGNEKEAPFDLSKMLLTMMLACN